MSYTALYRKWRSRTFDEVKGQEPITESFKNQIKTGRIGHAYLFCGTRGTGKTSVAKILARAVNCEHPVDGNPCNECPSCRAILSESSMNVIEMDAASNNGVDDIRQIRDQVAYPPVDGRYKVYIIDEVHMLSTSAFNAFLKTLEEPPEYVIFVLATTEPNKIPITILSRCQRYDFKRISTEVIAGRLREISDAEQIDITDDALHYIARVGDGSMRDAVSLLDQCSAFQFDKRISYEDALNILGAVDIRIFSELVRALRGRDIHKTMELVAEIVEQGRELSQFAADFLYYVRNMLMAKTVDDLNGLVDMSRENLARLREDAGSFSIDELLRYIRMLSELCNQLRYSMQKRVLIETTLMKLAYTETDVTPEGVNARIDALERKLQGISSGAFSMEAVMQSAGTSAPGTALSQTKQQPAEERVKLPKAQYEDLMLLKKNWKNIASAMPDGLLRTAFSNSWVNPDRAGNGMIIYTKSHSGYDMISSEAALREVQSVVSEKYKKEIEFHAVFADNDASRNTIYVQDEELAEKIHFEVETVDMEEHALTDSEDEPQ